MFKEADRTFEFGAFRLDLKERRLVGQAGPIPLAPKAFDTLVAFVENAGQLLTKEQLMQRLWPNSFVEEANLTVHISALRKVLGDRGNGNAFIQTVPRQGYRFIAEVRTLPPNRILGNESDQIAEAGVRRESELGLAGTLPSTSELAIPSYALKIQPELAERLRPKNWFGYDFRRVIRVLVGIVVIPAGVVWFFFHGNRDPFQKVSLLRLTTSGKAVGATAAISPDGRYVAYAERDDSEKQALWLRQVASTSRAELITASDVNYKGVAFAPDGNFVYVLRNEGGNAGGGVLYQVPTIGGPLRRIMGNVTSPISFSPDGRRFAFIRSFLPFLEFSLMLANADGTEERLLAKRTLPDFFLNSRHDAGPAWSPDGKTIACPGGTFAGGVRSYTVAIRVSDGSGQVINSHSWSLVGQPAWLSDGSGLILPGRDSRSESFLQLWYLPYFSGKPQRIYNDFNNYFGVSLTTDSQSLVSVQSHIYSDLWTVTSGGTDPRQITSGTVDHSNPSWTPDKRILYWSISSGNSDIWVMNEDGSHPVQLTTNPGPDIWPTVSRKNGTITFVSIQLQKRSGLVRMDLNGDNQRYLTEPGEDTYLPYISPDGQWVTYVSNLKGRSLWRINASGGKPEPLPYQCSTTPVFSPDSKLVACCEPGEGTLHVKIYPFEGAVATQSLSLPPTASDCIRWTADGQSLSYIDTHEGISNIWTEPLSEGPARQVTGFSSEKIFSFDWAPDGKKLVCERGHEESNVVLVRQVP